MSATIAVTAWRNTLLSVCTSRTCMIRMMGTPAFSMERNCLVKRIKSLVLMLPPRALILAQSESRSAAVSSVTRCGISPRDTRMVLAF